jgi:vacuolar-type H+-ATPase subunit I/STV1
MSEDTGTEKTESQVAEPTAIEATAMEMGWRPKTEWQGEEEDFVEAKEFVQRASLYEKIDRQGKQLREVTRALDGLKQHYGKVEQAAYDRALKALKEQRKEALTEGDGEKFEHLDDQIKQVEQEAEQARQAAEVPVIQNNEAQQVFMSWVNKNSWYRNDAEARDFADSFGVGLANRGLPQDEVLKRVEIAVRNQFPTKFRNPKKDEAPHTEASKGSGGGKASQEFQLTEQERSVMNSLVRQKVMTKEEYIESLKKVRG